METIEGKTFRGDKFCVDNKFLIRCIFDRCEIIYTGGDFGWRDTQFTNCRMVFEGAATRTVNFLKFFGFQINPPGQQPATQTTSGSIN